MCYILWAEFRLLISIALKLHKPLAHEFKACGYETVQINDRVMPEAPTKILISRLLINKLQNVCPFISFKSLNVEHKIQFKDARCLEAVNVSSCNSCASWNNWCLHIPGEDLGFNVF